MCGFYWTGGFANTSEACGYFFLLVVFFVFYSVSIGFLIAAITENPTSAGKNDAQKTMFCALIQDIVHV